MNIAPDHWFLVFLGLITYQSRIVYIVAHRMNMFFYSFLLLLLLVLVTEDGDLSPVCLFKFIINPHSFGQTIENLFHLSFLVRVSCVPLRKRSNILDNPQTYAAP